MNGYIAAGDAAVNFGAGPLAVAAANDPTFGRWLDSAKAMSNGFANLDQEYDRPSRGNADSPSGTKSDADGHSLTVTWNFDDMGALGDVEFKSMTGWREVNSRNIGDLDGFDNTIAPGGSGALNDSALGALYSSYAGQARFPAGFVARSDGGHRQAVEPDRPVWRRRLRAGRQLRLRAVLAGTADGRLDRARGIRPRLLLLRG